MRRTWASRRICSALSRCAFELRLRGGMLDRGALGYSCPPFSTVFHFMTSFRLPHFQLHGQMDWASRAGACVCCKRDCERYACNDQRATCYVRPKSLACISRLTGPATFDALISFSYKIPAHACTVHIFQIVSILVQVRSGHLLTFRAITPSRFSLALSQPGRSTSAASKAATASLGRCCSSRTTPS